ncbi:MAG: hypothetical protein GY847_19500 [Proteobacteria bacterium]|nr:hypothetical protein [Pseudomonadota bacterium]
MDEKMFNDEMSDEEELDEEFSSVIENDLDEEKPVSGEGETEASETQETEESAAWNSDEESGWKSSAGLESESQETEESTSWNDDEESGWKPSIGMESTDGSPAKEIKVAVDWIELEGALENNSPELHSFLNTVTGDVIRVFEGGENAELRLKQAEASPDYLYVDPVSSREQYRWMEEFIEIVEEPTLKDKLNIAIDGKGAFRRFKDVLVGYPAERERWFQKRSVKLRAHITEWLGTKHVIPTNIPPWEGDDESGDTQDESRQGRSDFESRAWRDGAADLRTTAHEMIDLIPSRELPQAVAFLEFLRSRRGYRRSRFG